MLAEDARATGGQALSRFLNVVDGLIGQGLDLFVLVTTNEPLRKLHPAVARHGRCLAEIEFDVLTVGEANSWLSGRGSTITVDTPTSLAQLFAIESGRADRPERTAVGFAA